jgi:SAM-dependent methyltransferase
MSAPDSVNPSTGINPAEFAHIFATEESFWWFRGMDRMLWQFLDPHLSAFAGVPACEVGCGTGWVSQQLRQRYPACPVTSLDLEQEGLSYASRRGLTELVVGDIRMLPLANEAYRLLLALDVIAHLVPGEEQYAADEFARVLQPGGILVLRASAFDWLRSRHSAFVHERQRVTKARLRPVLDRAGFQILRATYANTLLLPVSLLKFRIWEPLVKAKPKSGLQPIHPALNCALECVLRMETAWLRSGRNLPVGQSLWVIARKREGAK